MYDFVQRSDPHLPIAFIRKATLVDFLENTPDLVKACTKINMSAFEKDMATKINQRPKPCSNQSQVLDRRHAPLRIQPRTSTKTGKPLLQPINAGNQLTQDTRTTRSIRATSATKNRYPEPHYPRNCPATIRNLDRDTCTKTKMAGSIQKWNCSYAP